MSDRTMSDLNWKVPSSGLDITKAISGKTVENVDVGHCLVKILFTDKSWLTIEYDWIYGWWVTRPQEEETQ